jgi:PAS domain S-box-containing protein
MARITPVVSRVLPVAGRRGVPTAEARLALLEFLLASDDVAECAERALEWLIEHAGLRQAVCLGVDAEEKRLVGLAAFGIPSLKLEGLSVELDTSEHPLIRAFSGAYPAVIPGDGVEPPLPGAGAESLLGVPLRGLEDKQDVPAGLLLVRPRYGVNREVRWLAEILGHKLKSLRSWRAIADSEGRLRRERSLLYDIIDSVPDPILLTDAEGRLRIANARAELLFATTEEHSEGRQRAIGLNNMLFSSALGQIALESQDPTRRELLLVDPTEGSDLLFELLSAVTGDSREGTGIVSILRNVTDLRRATEEIEENYRKLGIAESLIRAERDRLELIINSVADPILVTDPSGNLVMMNAPAERLFTASSGPSEKEEAPRVRANDANFTSFVSNLFFSTTELSYRGGVSLVDPKTGATIPVEAVSGKILSEHGEVSAIVTILHDRTEALERERLYDQLKQASAELEQKVREATTELVHQNELLRRQALQLEQASVAKSQFLASMSHELRTPLNAIMGYTSLLLKGVTGELTRPQKENLARVDANARHLLAVIKDILDISRIEAGKMPLRIGEVQLSQLITEAVTEAEPLIISSKLKVTTDVASRLPTVRTDRQKVKQIVLNLLTNALKFTPQGSVRVSCEFVRPTGEIAIAVADTGVGIAEEDQARVFEDFSQADSSATRASGGAGLGLAICRRLATVLRGRITLESQPGRGSTFTLYLPRRPGRR